MNLQSKKQGGSRVEWESLGSRSGGAAAGGAEKKDRLLGFSQTIPDAQRV